jgi:hypothetical protein
MYVKAASQLACRLSSRFTAEMRAYVLQYASHRPAVRPDINIRTNEHVDSPRVGARERVRYRSEALCNSQNFLDSYSEVLYHSFIHFGLFWPCVFKRRSYSDQEDTFAANRNPEVSGLRVFLCLNALKLFGLYQDVVFLKEKPPYCPGLYDG